MPGVGFAGLVHPGLIGCLPDPKLLDLWNEREIDFIAANPDHPTGVANPPFAATAHMGALKGRGQGEGRRHRRAHGAAARARRQHGHQGSVARLEDLLPRLRARRRPLDGRPALFSQGDGEITFCGAIEMAGWLHLKVDVIKDGMSKYGIKSPIFKPSPIKPNYTDFLIFDGISVDEMGKQYYLDVGVAYRQACLAAIEYLKKFGYSGEQAYSILGTAPVQGHISGVVDVPNACATLWIPTEIFDFDINPGMAGPTKFLDGSVVLPTAPDL